VRGVPLRQARTALHPHDEARTEQCGGALARSCAKMEASPPTKGERALLNAPAPQTANLPAPLRQQMKLHFDTSEHDIYGATVGLLHSLGSKFGSFGNDPAATAVASAAEEQNPKLESYVPRAGSEIFTSFRLRRQLYLAAGRDERLCAAYDKLVVDVILPWIKRQLVEAGDAAAAQPMTWHYQRPPSVRIQPPDPSAFCRAHRDAEFGHQPGELNFWMPLTDPALTQTTLWVESRPDLTDFHPMNLTHGEIGAFHGTLCHHHVPPNTSACTRVSLDFRIGIGCYFDVDWQLRDAKAQHTRRQVTL
jgi:hypothetical protein